VERGQAVSESGSEAGIFEELSDKL